MLSLSSRENFINSAPRRIANRIDIIPHGDQLIAGLNCGADSIILDPAARRSLPKQFAAECERIARLYQRLASDVRASM